MATTLSGLVACGGSSEAKAPSVGNEDHAKRESIGEIAAAQGGLASLSGEGNRNEGSASGNEVAMKGPLFADPIDPANPVKLDGILSEWPTQSPATNTISGTTTGIGFGVAVKYDDNKIYVAGEVTNPKLARGASHSEADDHVTMTLAFPSSGGSLKAYAIGFWPGKPGETAGYVSWASGPKAGRAALGARIVEAETKSGYTFEVALPWSTFAEARTLRVGLRASFRYVDGDGRRVRGVLATGPGSVQNPFELPALPTAPEQAVVDELLEPMNLAGQPPSIDVFSDVTGDERKERISVFGSFFTICGPGYLDGRQFLWRELSGTITSLESRSLDGASKDVLFARRRFKQNGAERERLEIWSLANGNEPSTIFSHEIAIASADGQRRLSNAVRISSNEVEVSAEPAAGWDQASFHEPIANDDRAILLPWGGVKSQTFRYEKGQFVQVGAQHAAPAKNDHAPHHRR